MVAGCRRPQPSQAPAHRSSSRRRDERSTRRHANRRRCASASMKGTGCRRSRCTWSRRASTRPAGGSSGSGTAQRPRRWSRVPRRATPATRPRPPTTRC